MKRFIVMGVLALLAGEAGAETWPTNCFPSYLRWREQNLMNGVIYTAIVERVAVITNLTAIGTYSLQGIQLPPAAPVWYRSNRADLLRYKKAVTNMLLRQVFAQTNIADNFTAYFNAQMSVSNNTYTLPSASIASVLSNVCLPKNYFEYTPWSCLDGVGPYTNDTTVGHSYGWMVPGVTEPEYAGDNFPPGRTNWYSTDYGWDGMTGILSQLTWVLGNADDVSEYPTYVGRFSTTSEYCYGYVSHYSPPVNPYVTWDDTCAEAAAIYTNRGEFYEGIIENYSRGYRGLNPPESSNFVAQAKGYIAYSHHKMEDAKPREMQFYFLTTWPGEGLSSLSNTVYDGGNGNYTNKGAWVVDGTNLNSAIGPEFHPYPWGVQCETNMTVGSTSVTMRIGSTNLPPWCTEPAIYRYNAKGWGKYDNMAFLFKFDGTNGFKYR
jgi:hypothetical protein